MKSLVFIGLIALATMFATGCTTYNGISKAEKPGTYYVITNTKKLVGTRPGLLLCTTDEEGNLKCKRVRCR